MFLYSQRRHFRSLCEGALQWSWPMVQLEWLKMWVNVYFIFLFICEFSITSQSCLIQKLQLVQPHTSNILFPQQNIFPIFLFSDSPNVFESCYTCVILMVVCFGWYHYVLNNAALFIWELTLTSHSGSKSDGTNNGHRIWYHNCYRLHRCSSNMESKQWGKNSKKEQTYKCRTWNQQNPAAWRYL